MPVELYDLLFLLELGLLSMAEIVQPSASFPMATCVGSRPDWQLNFLKRGTWIIYGLSGASLILNPPLRVSMWHVGLLKRSTIGLVSCPCNLCLWVLKHPIRYLDAGHTYIKTIRNQM